MKEASKHTLTYEPLITVCNHTGLLVIDRETDIAVVRLTCSRFLLFLTIDQNDHSTKSMGYQNSEQAHV